MREKRTTVLFLIIFFIIVTAMVVLSLLIGRIPKNPPGTVGNTAGNLNNKGCSVKMKISFIFQMPMTMVPLLYEHR